MHHVRNYKDISSINSNVEGNNENENCSINCSETPEEVRRSESR
jgi:hypothetical protein